MSITIEPERTTVTTEELERWATLPAPPAPYVPPRFPSIDEHVAKEAERLDRLFPGWEDRVNINTLDIASARNCILAQCAYKTTMFLRRRVPIGYGAGDDLVEADAAARNEMVFGSAYFSNSTRDAWIDEIKRRHT